MIRIKGIRDQDPWDQIRDPCSRMLAPACRLYWLTAACRRKRAGGHGAAVLRAAGALSPGLRATSAPALFLLQAIRPQLDGSEA